MTAWREFLTDKHRVLSVLNALKKKKKVSTEERVVLVNDKASYFD